jgi:three-Cys-motif partner protein
VRHKFGGIWTQKKLTVLDEYLRFYVTALKNKRFTLHYADAFAGTGSHVPSEDGRQETFLPLDNLRGSVLTALAVEPGFNQFHFNDLDAEHVQELRKIKLEHPHKNIALSEMDANEFVPQFCASLTNKDRAILFLDPYSTQLDWQTLQSVAASGKVDLWLLFPLSVLLRLTPKDSLKAKPEWKKTLDRLLGTSEWEASLYKPHVSPVMDDLFGDPTPPASSTRLNTDELQLWITQRLKTIFPYVGKPVTLCSNGSPLFLFYFAVSNKSPNAWGLADKAASHIVKKNL